MIKRLRQTNRTSVVNANGMQIVSIPDGLAFPKTVSEVVVRRQGGSLLITPLDRFWDEFFNEPGSDIEEPTQLAFDKREPW